MLCGETADVNCLAKDIAIFYVAGEGFGGKSDGLIERGFGSFPMEGFDYAS